MDGEKSRLLIVDRSRSVANTTALVFARAGYEAKAAYSAEQALELVQDWQPSVAILEVSLPKTDGVALGRRMRTMFPDCRVILFTTQDLVEDEAVPLFDEFLVFSKPVPPTSFLALVGSARAGLDT